MYACSRETRTSSVETTCPACSAWKNTNCPASRSTRSSKNVRGKKYQLGRAAPPHRVLVHLDERVEPGAGGVDLDLDAVALGRLHVRADLAVVLHPDRGEVRAERPHDVRPARLGRRREPRELRVEEREPREGRDDPRRPAPRRRARARTPRRRGGRRRTRTGRRSRTARSRRSGASPGAAHGSAASGRKHEREQDRAALVLADGADGAVARAGEEPDVLGVGEDLAPGPALPEREPVGEVRRDGASSTRWRIGHSSARAGAGGAAGAAAAARRGRPAGSGNPSERSSVGDDVGAPDHLGDRARQDPEVERRGTSGRRTRRRARAAP